MSNENELLQLLHDADPINDNQFRKIVLSSMEIFVLDERGLACELGVSWTTVNRWRNGNSTPHPAIRRLLFCSLMQKLEARIAKFDN